MAARRSRAPELALRLRSVAMGRAVYHAALAFWAGVAEDPEDVSR